MVIILAVAFLVLVVTITWMRDGPRHRHRRRGMP